MTSRPDAGPDRVLARMERDTVVACLAMAVLALAATGGRWDVALGILGGGALVATSYIGMKGAAYAFVRAAVRAAATPRLEAEPGTGGRDGASAGGEPPVGAVAEPGPEGALVAAAAHGEGDRSEGEARPSGEADGGAGESSGTRETPAARGRFRKREVLVFVNVFIRYALLAVGAYAILARFRAHPVGVLVGVSSPVVAAAAELARSLRRRA